MNKIKELIALENVGLMEEVLICLSQGYKPKEIEGLYKNYNKDGVVVLVSEGEKNSNGVTKHKIKVIRNTNES